MNTPTDKLVNEFDPQKLDELLLGTTDPSKYKNVCFTFSKVRPGHGGTMHVLAIRCPNKTAPRMSLPSEEEVVVIGVFASGNASDRRYVAIHGLTGSATSSAMKDCGLIAAVKKFQQDDGPVTTHCPVTLGRRMAYLAFAYASQKRWWTPWDALVATIWVRRDRSVLDTLLDDVSDRESTELFLPLAPNEASRKESRQHVVDLLPMDAREIVVKKTQRVVDLKTALQTPPATFAEQWKACHAALIDLGRQKERNVYSRCDPRQVLDDDCLAAILQNVREEAGLDGSTNPLAMRYVDMLYSKQQVMRHNSAQINTSRKRLLENEFWSSSDKGFLRRAEEYSYQAERDLCDYFASKCDSKSLLVLKQLRAVSKSWAEDVSLSKDVVCHMHTLLQMRTHQETPTELCLHQGSNASVLVSVRKRPTNLLSTLQADDAHAMRAVQHHQVGKQHFLVLVPQYEVEYYSPATQDRPCSLQMRPPPPQSMVRRENDKLAHTSMIQTSVFLPRWSETQPDARPLCTDGEGCGFCEARVVVKPTFCKANITPSGVWSTSTDPWQTGRVRIVVRPFVLKRVPEEADVFFDPLLADREALALQTCDGEERGGVEELFRIGRALCLRSESPPFTVVSRPKKRRQPSDPQTPSAQEAASSRAQTPGLSHPHLHVPSRTNSLFVHCPTPPHHFAN